jgi:hypothetical protein
MKMNGYQTDVRRVVKGPYKKTDPGWWHKQGQSLVEKTTIAGINKWKWVRFLK